MQVRECQKESKNGTPIVLITPDPGTNYSKSKEELEKEKEEIIAEDMKHPENVTKVKTKSDEEIFSSLEEDLPFIVVLEKYYGKAYIREKYYDLVMEQKEFAQKIKLDEKRDLSELQIQFYKMAIDIINGENTTTDEKDIMLNALKEENFDVFNENDLINEIEEILKNN